MEFLPSRSGVLAVRMSCQPDPIVRRKLGTPTRKTHLRVSNKLDEDPLPYTLFSA